MKSEAFAVALGHRFMPVISLRVSNRMLDERSEVHTIYFWNFPACPAYSMELRRTIAIQCPRVLFNQLLSFKQVLSCRETKEYCR